MRNMRCPQENQVTRLGPAPDEIPIPLKPDQRAKSEPFGEKNCHRLPGKKRSPLAPAVTLQNGTKKTI